MCSNFRLDGRAVDISLPGLLSAVTEGGFRPCPDLQASGQAALSFARSGLTRGIAGIACRLTFGLQGGTESNIARGLLGDLDNAGSLLGGLAGNARQPGSLAIGNTRIAGDVDCVPGGLTFDECRISRAGFRAKLLQFQPSSRSPLCPGMSRCVLKFARQASLVD
jgi:hypothetical protein